MNLAPVGIFTYTRVEHLKKTIEALKNNALSKDTELFIFSDGPKVGDEEKVMILRSYLETIDGFKRVNIMALHENNMSQNIMGNTRFLCKNFDRFIIMEDDNVTSASFLTFMNIALEKYKNNKSVMSIGGYCPPINIPTTYKYDVYFSKIYCPWGAGIWSERMEYILSNCDFSNHSLNNYLEIEMKYLGKNLRRRFKSLPKHRLSDHELFLKFDTCATALMIKQKMFTILPVKNLVENIGLDGSGLNCSEKDYRFMRKADHEFIADKFPDKTTINNNIIYEMYLAQSYSKNKNQLMKLIYFFSRAINYFLSVQINKIDCFAAR